MAQDVNSEALSAKAAITISRSIILRVALLPVAVWLWRKHTTSSFGTRQTVKTAFGVNHKRNARFAIVVRSATLAHSVPVFQTK